MAGGRPVSALRARAGEYLAMWLGLGFKLESHGPRLMSFVRFCEDRGATAAEAHGPGGGVGDLDRQRSRGLPGPPP